MYYLLVVISDVVSHHNYSELVPVLKYLFGKVFCTLSQRV